ncbi:MAG: sulfoxide reductase heme-binding subunit YedZ [Acidobacteriota bacterium]|nr:sulfoxide reductase heme-binding subunit YedZ [Acidobacteriota bacterium]
MRNQGIVLLKVAVFLACLGPLAYLLWEYHADDLGANPIEVITHTTGLSTLVFLLITLSITPLRTLSRQPRLIRFRRMLGLFAFFYGCLHFTTYIWLDQFFDWANMVKDVQKRPFITAGFTGFVLMIPLALTSTSWAVRKLGGKRWQWLHRLIYVSATAGVTHFLWLVKKDISEPLMYAGVLALLLLYRIGAWGIPALKARRARLTESAP